MNNLSFEDEDIPAIIWFLFIIICLFISWNISYLLWTSAVESDKAKHWPTI